MVWHPYLLGQKFIIQIDKQALKYLLEQWVLRHNIINGFLSCKGMILKSALAVLDVEVIKREVEHDPKLTKIIQQCGEDIESVPKFELSQGKLR